MVYSLLQDTELTNVFFTFKMSYYLMLQVQNVISLEPIRKLERLLS